jgi:ankyrin repeat protein
LHQAVLSGDAATPKLVADNVKDMNITNNNGYTALDLHASMDTSKSPIC